jgi:uracil-DNA glycosylase
VPTLDDERFETYLKRFRPMVPDGLPIKKRKRESWRFWLQIAVAGATVIVILGSAALRITMNRVGHKPGNPRPVAVIEMTRPLRIGDANALLTTAPSYESAIRDLAFRPERSIFPKTKQSALAVLAKEKIKL